MGPCLGIGHPHVENFPKKGVFIPFLYIRWKRSWSDCWLASSPSPKFFDRLFYSGLNFDKILPTLKWMATEQKLLLQPNRHGKVKSICCTSMPSLLHCPLIFLAPIALHAILLLIWLPNCNSSSWEMLTLNIRKEKWIRKMLIEQYRPWVLKLKRV